MTRGAPPSSGSGCTCVPAEPGPIRGCCSGSRCGDNPRRAQLLVSRVLGKHVPTDPRVVHAAGLLLGALVADALAARPPRALPVDLLHAAVRGAPGAAGALHVEAREAIAPEPVDAVVLGFAETATALGHCVAEALGGADYLHSTRRPVAGVATAGAFVEEHSHHTGHLLLPSDPALLAGPRPLVLVDDELSTGRTAVNTITALHRAAPRAHYVLATLVDLREDALAGLPDGVRVDVVALTRARLDAARPTSPTRAARRLRAASAPRSARGTRPSRAGHAARPRRPTPHERACRLTDLGWPAGLPAGARHGFTAAPPPAAGRRAPRAGRRPRPRGRRAAGERTLVLGTEELMAAPLRLAAALADAGHDVRFSTTTRSPAVVVDEPDYALTSGIAFPSHDDPADGPGPRYAYNVARRWDHVLVVVDPPADTTGPAHRAPPGARPAHPAHHRGGHAVSTPEPLRGPAFGSYPPDEVAWLLTDLSDVALEAPTEEREEAVQSGGAHYAESLPHEYQPDAAYLRLYHEALAGIGRHGSPRPSASSPSWCSPSADPTSCSRRWPGRAPRSAPCCAAGPRPATGSTLPHYAVSIVRGRGIDAVALRHLAEHHDPARVVFVDGWTGKGAINRELAAALRGTPFSPELAVLADPGRCTQHVRHARGLAHPVRLPQLDGVRAGVAHRPQRPADPPRHVPRREVLRRARAGGRLHRLPRRRRRAVRPPSPTPARPATALPTTPASRASNASRRRTASATSTSSSPASGRPPACCCAGSRGRCSSGPERPPPTSRTCGCWPRSAASRSRRCPSWPTAASG